MKLLRCLITAGPTREHLDPVRFLSNGSSGKMGYALAAAAAERRWGVDLISGPVALPDPVGVRVRRVVSAQEMFEAAEAVFAACDVFIAVAAVADFRPKTVSPTKIKKAGASQVLELEPTIDILRTLAARKTAQQTIVGFAAETNDVETYARRKLVEKNLDWVVANDISDPSIGMNVDANAVVIISREGARVAFGPAPKAEVANYILNTIAARLPL